MSVLEFLCHLRSLSSVVIHRTRTEVNTYTGARARARTHTHTQRTLVNNLTVYILQLHGNHSLCTLKFLDISLTAVKSSDISRFFRRVVSLIDFRLRKYVEQYVETIM